MKTPIDIHAILKALPHRYPFLLIDRVESITEDSIIAKKNVTYNELFFQGHFPSHPIMPGVLIVEAMAQAAGVLFLNSDPSYAGKIFFFASIENAKFRRPVSPGDSLMIHCKMFSVKGGFCKFECEALVDEKKAAEATIVIAQMKERNA